MPSAAPDARSVMLTATFIYGNNDCCVTVPKTKADQEKCLVRSEDGAWVKAWVYVPYVVVKGNHEK